MQTFWDWLRLRHFLAETYFSFDTKQYNTLFDSELEKAIARVRDPACRQALERLRGFNWLSYIVGSVWHAGFRDQRERDEKAHEIVVKLLLGKLFRGYDERIHGPLELRFRRSVGNAIRNIVEKEKARRRNVPTVSISQEFSPGSVTAEEFPPAPFPTTRRRSSKASASSCDGGLATSPLPCSTYVWKAARRSRL